MRIADVNIPAGFLKNIASDSLGFDDALRMPRLGRFVVLAGSNGAGKSRLLKALSIIGNNRFNIGQQKDLIESLENFERSLEAALNKKIDFLKNFRSSNPPGLSVDEATLGMLDQPINFSQKSIQEIENLNGYWTNLTTEPENIGFRPVFFLPTVPTLHSPGNHSDHSLQSCAENLTTLGMGGADQNVPAYIKWVLRAARNCQISPPGNEVETWERNDFIASGIALKNIICELLGEAAAPCIDPTDKVKIFGRSDFTESLSSGQKILLMLATALHAQKTHFKDALLFLDEPENHLHPSVLNTVIDRLLERVVDGQVWIATHSIPLIAKLSHAEPGCLWFVSDSTVSHAGRKPEAVLRGLIGDEEEVAKLRDFTDLPAQLASNRYAAECLLAPTTVPPREGDAQQVQMANILTSDKPNGILRILDFGAGKGRLLAALQGAVGDASKRFDYIAVDLKGKDNDQCIKQIESVYGSSEGRFFHDLTQVRQQYRDGVDKVVMCNVLHEIPPAEWLSLLGKSSDLYSLLRDDGALLVVEDQRIPVGERAHHYGFMVFDTLQFYELFSIKQEDIKAERYSYHDARNDGRLKAHTIVKEILSRISPESRKQAIQSLSHVSAKSIKDIRSQSGSFINGQVHAFWTAQFANAELWLSEN